MATRRTQDARCRTAARSIGLTRDEERPPRSACAARHVVAGATRAHGAASTDGLVDPTGTEPIPDAPAPFTGQAILAIGFVKYVIATGDTEDRHLGRVRRAHRSVTDDRDASRRRRWRAARAARARCTRGTGSPSRAVEQRLPGSRGGRFGRMFGFLPERDPAIDAIERPASASACDDRAAASTTIPGGLHVPRPVRRPRHHVRSDVAPAARQRPARARELPHAAPGPRLALRLGPRRPAVPLRLGRRGATAA